MTEEVIVPVDGSNEAITAAAAQAETAGVQVPLPPIKVAFVIDGLLVDVLHTDARLGAIFLSNPVMVDVTDIYDPNNPLPLNSIYDAETNTWSLPIPEQPTE
jgi:hypothetical protein